MFQLIPSTKIYKRFFVGACVALVIIFGVLLIQDYTRNSESDNYNIKDTMVYLTVSVLLFVPFITSVLKLLLDTYKKNVAIYWFSTVFLTVLTLVVFFLFSGAVLHLLGYFDNYISAIYARQYFGKEAMYHLLILAATGVYVHHQESTGNTTVISGSLNGKEINIRASQINWIEEDKQSLNLHTDSQKVLKKATMAEISKELEPLFVQINRKYLVNQNKVVAKEREKQSEFVVLNSGERLRVGKSYRDNLGEDSWVEV